jgi:hypothetical protein
MDDDPVKTRRQIRPPLPRVASARARLRGAEHKLVPSHSRTFALLTTLWLTSALFELFVDGGMEKLASVRQLLTGGEVMSERHAALQVGRCAAPARGRHARVHRAHARAP